MIRTSKNIEYYVLAVYIICFAIGTVMHGIDFLILGWRPYNWGPPLLEVFWTSLVVLDALVVVLLVFGERRRGLLLALTIMVLDVIANSYALIGLRMQVFMVPVILQTAFLGFILGSIAFLWPRNTG